MKTNRYVAFTLVLFFLMSCTGIPGKFTEKNISPPLFPDVTEVTVPVNIAPLNFKITVSSQKIVAGFETPTGKLKIAGKRKIIIPANKWKGVLSESAGAGISVTVFSKEGNVWVKYLPFKIYVSREPIDQYLVYRRIAPGYESWSEMGLYQRDLSGFNEITLIDNRLLPGNCMNCHSFNQNDPEQMMFHLRGNVSGTILLKEGEESKLNLKTKEIGMNCVYPNWHPSGSFIAYSVNDISQVFHTTKEKRIEVMDSRSDLVVFDIANNKLITDSVIFSNERFETFPVFSSDGKTLYFCSAKKGVLPDDYDRIKYSLCSVSFDPQTGFFGDRIDTLVNAEKIGKSVSFPRTSPDGKYLMFTLSEYGNFSIWHREADLWLLNISDGTIKPVESANSDNTESFHSWSSGSQWFVFSSRRKDGLYTSPYFALLDENGEASKPFMLPQKDPDFYDRFIQSFNVPELVKAKIETNGRQMLKTIGSEAKSVTFEIKE